MGIGEQQYEKMVFCFKFSTCAISLGVGCSNEKTAKTDEPKKESVQKEKELTAKRCFQENERSLKTEEHVTMTYVAAHENAKAFHDKCEKPQRH